VSIGLDGFARSLHRDCGPEVWRSYVHERNQLTREALTYLERISDVHHDEQSVTDEPRQNVILEQLAPVNRIQREGGMWHLRYQDESGDYPVRGNQSISWLAKLLAAPNRRLAVADLRGDPECMLAADAMLGTEPEMDPEGMALIRRRLQEIADITAETGGSESFQEEESRLLERLKQSPGAGVLKSQLRRDHANIATQLRNLRRKLKSDMPNLAAHLKAYLKLEFPEFGYYPAHPSPDWHI
jgi:hypothetical protein